MRALLGRCKLLERDRAALRTQLDQSEGRVGMLESELRELNQKRRDVAKRIDGLIGQIDSLEVQLGGGRDG